MGESSVQHDDNDVEHVITSGSKQKVILTLNGTGGVMVSEFTSSVVDRRFEPLSGQLYGDRTKTGWLGIRIICLEWDNMSIRRLLFQ
jgi:hypothetical protein